MTTHNGNGKGNGNVDKKTVVTKKKESAKAAIKRNEEEKKAQISEKEARKMNEEKMSKNIYHLQQKKLFLGITGEEEQINKESGKQDCNDNDADIIGGDSETLSGANELEMGCFLFQFDVELMNTESSKKQVGSCDFGLGEDESIGTFSVDEVEMLIDFKHPNFWKNHDIKQMDTKRSKKGDENQNEDELEETSFSFDFDDELETLFEDSNFWENLGYTDMEYGSWGSFYL